MALQRIIPHNNYIYLPCSIVACGCALDYQAQTLLTGNSVKTVQKAAEAFYYKEDGYLTLENLNRLVRQLLRVKRGGYHYYRRGERRFLCNIDFTGKLAIVLVYGHVIFVADNVYYSFFNNLDDSVVAIWELER